MYAESYACTENIERCGVLKRLFWSLLVASRSFFPCRLRRFVWTERSAGLVAVAGPYHGTRPIPLAKGQAKIDARFVIHGSHAARLFFHGRLKLALPILILPFFPHDRSRVSREITNNYEYHLQESTQQTNERRRRHGNHYSLPGQHRCPRPALLLVCTNIMLPTGLPEVRRGVCVVCLALCLPVCLPFYLSVADRQLRRETGRWTRRVHPTR